MVSPEYCKESEIRIVVTDSGLGGLSVAARLVEKLKEARIANRVQVIYFNGKPSDESGYNLMGSFEQRERVFSNALEYMTQQFSPAFILIACNTLSVLYDQTAYASNAGIPVLGIVEPSVEMIHQALSSDPQTRLILFATPSTIASGVYANRMMDCDRVFFQSCSGLAEAIEESTHGPETAALIDRYVGEGIDRNQLHGDPVGMSLNCTHFGYSRDLFHTAFEKKGSHLAVSLNPNEKLADDFLARFTQGVCPQSSIEVEVISHTSISPSQIASIRHPVQALSIQTADAFQNFHYTPQCFEID